MNPLGDDSWSEDDGMIPLPVEDDNIDSLIQQEAEHQKYVAFLAEGAKELAEGSRAMDDLMKRHGGILFLSQERHIAVQDAVIARLLGPKFPYLIDQRIGQFCELGLDTEAIIKIILDDELPNDPLKHMSTARKVAELKEAAFRHLLKKHGLEALTKKKEEEIEQMLLAGKSFEFILTAVTESSLHPFLHQLE